MQYPESEEKSRNCNDPYNIHQIEHGGGSIILLEWPSFILL